MWVICSHSKVFHKMDIEPGTKDSDGKIVIPQSTERFYAGRNPNAQQIPDWCSGTPTFKTGVADGSIRDLSPKALDAEKDAGEVKPKEPRDDSNSTDRVPGYGLKKAKRNSGNDVLITPGE